MQRIVAGLLVFMAAACSRDRGPQLAGRGMPVEVQQSRATWPPGLTALIDSATAAYDAEEFERASLLYRRATLLDPQLSTGWFGVYIAEHARGRIEAADSALARARELVAQTDR